MLPQFSLFVAGRRPEFVALVFLLLGGDLAVVADDGVAAFFTEGRVGEDHVELGAAGLGEGEGVGDGVACPSLAQRRRVESQLGHLRACPP